MMVETTLLWSARVSQMPLSLAKLSSIGNLIFSQQTWRTFPFRSHVFPEILAACILQLIPASFRLGGWSLADDIAAVLRPGCPVAMATWRICRIMHFRHFSSH